MLIAEDVGMAANQLAGDAMHHVFQPELARLLRQLHVEEHLQEQVAQFVAELIGVVLIQGGEGLVGFLDEVGLERGVGLHAVPGAAIGPSQVGDDPAQALEGAQFGFRYVHRPSFPLDVRL